ncbi:MAG: hypothetical protein LBH47_02445 [Christensenellaceae bacterium]|nr:hypothetical protein [Christensenellaceae bacterium]
MKILEIIADSFSPVIRNEITCFKSNTDNDGGIEEGYVHTLPNFSAILLTKNFLPYFITPRLVNQYNLKMGDYATVKYEYYNVCSRHEVIDIIKVVDKKVFFDDAEGINSDGKRGITTAITISSNQYQIEKVTNYVQDMNGYKIAVLVDGRKEQAEYLNNIGFDEAYFSPAGKSPAYKTLNVLYALFKAKDVAVTEKKDVILTLSFTKIFTAFNMVTWGSDHVDPNTISPIAITDLMNYTSCTKCLKDGGSLTIVGTLNEEIYPAINQQIKDLCDKLIE